MFLVIVGLLPVCVDGERAESCRRRLPVRVLPRSRLPLPLPAAPALKSKRSAERYTSGDRLPVLPVCEANQGTESGLSVPVARRR